MENDSGAVGAANSGGRPVLVPITIEPRFEEAPVYKREVVTQTIASKAQYLRKYDSYYESFRQKFGGCE